MSRTGVTLALALAVSAAGCAGGDEASADDPSEEEVGADTVDLTLAGKALVVHE